VGDLALVLDATEDQVSYALKMLRLAGPSAARFCASRRCIPGLCGFASADTALTNHRMPSAQRSLAAAPGLNPPRWVCAATTGAPQISSAAARTSAGSISQATRMPSAAGAVMSWEFVGPAADGQRI